MALQNANNTKTQLHNEKINDLHMTLCLFLAKFMEMVLNMGQVTVDELINLFWETRDGWIDSDLAGWEIMNPLFAGVATKLNELGKRRPWYVVTRKQERFVKQILKANGIELADERIFGQDRNMSKLEVLAVHSEPVERPGVMSIMVRQKHHE